MVVVQYVALMDLVGRCGDIALVKAVEVEQTVCVVGKDLSATEGLYRTRGGDRKPVKVENRARTQ